MVEHFQVEVTDLGVDNAFNTLVLNDLSLMSKGDSGLGLPVHIDVHAAGVDGGERRSARIELSAIPIDLVMSPLPASRVRISMPHTDLPQAMAWFALPPIFVGGSIDLNVDVMTDGDIITVGLDVDGTGLADVVSTGAGAGVEDEAAAGVASLHGIIVFELDRGRTSFEHVVFEGAGMTVRGAARYTAATLGGIESLDVTVAATEMARLGLLIPPLRTTVPGALRLSGAGSGSLRASPTEVNIELDLDGTNVRLGEALQKNAGDRLQVSLHGNRDSDAAHHREGANRASGRVDAAVDVVLPHGVHIMGDVMFQPGGPDIALFDLHTNRPTLAHAATLSPVLRDLVAGAVERVHCALQCWA